MSFFSSSVQLVRSTLLDPVLQVVDWVKSFFNPHDGRTSMRRASMAASVVMLCIACWKITSAMQYQIKTGQWHPTVGDVGLLGTVTVPLASLAGAAYLLRKDGTLQVGDLKNMVEDDTKPQNANPTPVDSNKAE